MTRFRMLMVAAAAVISFAVAANSASAETATLNPGGRFSAVSSGQVRLTAGLVSTQCDVTLNGSLATSASTAAGTSIGSITSGTAAPCTVGSVTVNTGAPWGLSIVRWLGTSPSYTGVLTTLTGVSFTVVVAGMTCPYSGAIGVLAPIAGGTITRLTMLSNSLPRVTPSSPLCPATASLATPQTFTLSPAQGITIAP